MSRKSPSLKAEGITECLTIFQALNAKPEDSRTCPGSSQTLWLQAQFSLYFSWFFLIKKEKPINLRRVRKHGAKGSIKRKEKTLPDK